MDHSANKMKPDVLTYGNENIPQEEMADEEDSNGEDNYLATSIKQQHQSPIPSHLMVSY